MLLKPIQGRPSGLYRFLHARAQCSRHFNHRLAEAAAPENPNKKRVRAVIMSEVMFGGGIFQDSYMEILLLTTPTLVTCSTPKLQSPP